MAGHQLLKCAHVALLRAPHQCLIIGGGMISITHLFDEQPVVFIRAKLHVCNVSPGKLKTGNPKFDAIPQLKTRKEVLNAGFCRFRYSNFAFVSNFELRVSNFATITACPWWLEVAPQFSSPFGRQNLPPSQTP